MNIDELANAIRLMSQKSVPQKLADLLINWKEDQTTVENLEERIEQYIRKTWIEKDENYETIYSYWTKFRDNAIHNINGMTMNERLYWFGLFEIFDNCLSKESELSIYTKLCAKL